MVYTEEQKRELVGRIDGLIADGKSQTAACRDVKVSPSSYRSWKAALREASTAVVHKVFISHRHGDRPIADALRHELLNWGFAESQVFQSSHEQSGAETGAPIRASLLKSILQSQLVILIFTYERYDWQYCMWEMGVAMGADRHKRKVLVLRAFEDKPKVFVADKDLRVDWSDIQRFVRNVHKDDGFFPDLPAFQPQIAATAFRERSKRLNKALKEAAERVVIKPGVRPTLRCGSITFRVDAARVAMADDLDGSEPQKIRALLEGAAIIKRASQDGLEHFGFGDPEPELGKNIVHLVRRWKTRVRPKATDEWATDLCMNLYYAIMNDASEPNWRPFRSAGQKNTWVIPLVQLRRLIEDGDMELDVDVYRMPGPAPEAAATAI